MNKSRPSSPNGPTRPPRPPSRHSLAQAGSRPSTNRISAGKSNRLPGDSVLFAPVYQEEQLDKLYKKLKESSLNVALMKEKLVEKAKATLGLKRLPQSGSFIPFFHFDEFNDVHLSFLQHNPPYTPWFSISETYFGPTVIELHKACYNLLVEHQNERYGPDQAEQINAVDHDILIDIDLDESYQPNYAITYLN